MKRHLHRWLNDEALKQMTNEAYEGRIKAVVEEVIRNKFNSQKNQEPVINFEDGWRLVPNIGQRKTLIELFGSSETEDWVGRVIVVFRRQVERTDKQGRTRVTWEKTVALPGPRR